MKLSKRIFFATVLFCFFMAGRSAFGQNLPFVFSNNLTIGSRGEDVSALQQFLIAGGFLNVTTSTGYFGSLTQSALGAWQTSVGIAPAVGYFGPLSRGKINTAVQPAPIVVTPNNVVGTTTSVIVATTTAAVGSTTSTEIGLPVSLTIPTLNIDAKFQYNGLKSDGTMEVPSNIYDVGWFTGSVHPGDKGVAIVTGHVAQIRGGVVTKPGVFSNLSTLSVGDKLYVQNDKGQTITFVVRALRNYDPTADATDVFTSTDDGAHLNLITCEGTWIPSAVSYTQRLVVFTDAVQ